jgi:hypothetical protein
MVFKAAAILMALVSVAGCSVANSEQNKIAAIAPAVPARTEASNQTTSRRDSEQRGSNGSDSGASAPVSLPMPPVDTPPGPIVAMTFSEAQTKCARCHSSTNTGPAPLKWNTADGTEADWGAKGQAIRESVVSGKMPVRPFSELDKARFLKFIDGLMSNDVADQ